MSDKTHHSLRDTAETFPSKLPEENFRAGQQNGDKKQNHQEEVKIFGPDNQPLDIKADMETAKELKPQINKERKDLLTEEDQDYIPNLKRLADLDVDYQGKKK